eukprot:3114119-Pyramimonas_sp.AAC.1
MSRTLVGPGVTEPGGDPVSPNTAVTFLGDSRSPPGISPPGLGVPRFGEERRRPPLPEALAPAPCPG